MVLDMQIQGFGNRFNKYTIKGCLLEDLKDFYHSVKEDEIFAKFDGIRDLAHLMVETEEDLSFPLAYRILKLALILPVVTVTVGRYFSKLKLIKTDLCNRMDEDYLNNALVYGSEEKHLIK
ncbi:uncharacterized protein LOC143594680 [Bidens hawaiensis]|uniref:uncharacterized protein LOC143594680 n=1 Tax=Bidens hawaiensis TaxID=980011 RepID=UPI00404A302B